MKALILAVLSSVMFFLLSADVLAQQQEPQTQDQIVIITEDSQETTSVRGSVVENSKRLRDRAKMSARGGIIVNNAKRYIGVPYVWAGTTSSGFDCSGFVMSVYAKSGINIRRLADEQFYNGKRISRDELEVGDLVFFETYTYGISHVGIYIGENRFIHSSSSKGVTIDSLDAPYFKIRYRGACRY